MRRASAKPAPIPRSSTPSRTARSGLRGVSFGNFLIKQVVEELKAELPNLTRFSTLSPVPGFRRWLDKRLNTSDGAPEPDLLRADERGAVFQAADMPEDAGEATIAMRALLHSEKWWDHPARESALRKPVLRACATYLTQASSGKGHADPVARFHLGNGARLERVNWLGNVAPRGIEESYGIMVNYLYDLDGDRGEPRSFRARRDRRPLGRSCRADGLNGRARSHKQSARAWAAVAFTRRLTAKAEFAPRAGR